MKKYYIVTSAILFIAMIMSIVGFMNGGLKSVAYNNGHVEVVSPKGKINVSKLKPFKKINIDTTDNDIEIKYGEKFSIRKEFNSNSVLNVDVSDRTLNVGQVKENRLNIGLFNDMYDKVTITIPRDKKMDEISISTIDGDVEMKEDLTSMLKIHSTDGSIKLTDMDLKKGSEINMSDDDIILENSKIENTKLITNDSDVSFNGVSPIGNNNQIVSSDGSIKINGLVNAGMISNSRNDEDTKTTYQGKVYDRKFEKDVKNKNLLTISSHDTKIDIN